MLLAPVYQALAAIKFVAIHLFLQPVDARDTPRQRLSSAPKQPPGTSAGVVGGGRDLWPFHSIGAGGVGDE